VTKNALYQFNFLQENVQSVLAAEQQVEQLMQQLESAIAEAERVEERLDAYDEILRHVRDAMEKMEEKNMLITIANINNQKLLVELENVIVRVFSYIFFFKCWAGCTFIQSNFFYPLQLDVIKF